MKLSKNFNSEEFSCRCGCGACCPHPVLIAKLQMLRDRLGRAVVVNCGTRCSVHNKEVGGAPKSYHLPAKVTGVCVSCIHAKQHSLGVDIPKNFSLAADITVSGMTPVQVAKAAKALGFTGIIVYSTFTHVDIRPGHYYDGV